MSTLADNLHRIQERIDAAARRAGRDPIEITLVAVTKTQPVETIVEACELGLRHFGENRAEEAAGKIPAVQSTIRALPSGIVWHMIGHVQSRKAAPVVDLFEWVHSVDSLKLAERLSRLAVPQDKILQVLLEFNLAGEASKYGLRFTRDTVDGELLREIEAITSLPNLHVDGLMTMAPMAPDSEQARPVFRALRELRQKLTDRLPYCAWRHLSMGMTDDFEVAIEEGATIVRIGRAIFGERRPPSA